MVDYTVKNPQNKNMLIEQIISRNQHEYFWENFITADASNYNFKTTIL